MRSAIWMMMGAGCALGAAPVHASEPPHASTLQASSLQAAGLQASAPKPLAAQPLALTPIAPVRSSTTLNSALLLDRSQPTFAAPVERTGLAPLDLSTRSLAYRPVGRVAAATGGDFVMPAYTGTALDPQRLLPAPRIIEGQGVVLWRSGEIVLGASPASGAVDSVRMTIGGIARLPAGLVTGRNVQASDVDPEAFDFTYTRGWPSALTFKAGAYDLDVSPHAGLGMSSTGGSAEAGAMVRLGANLEDDVVQRLASGLGVRAVDGQTYGSQARWYLFAAASGRAVGLNMTRDSQTGDLRRSGWSVDPSAAVIGDTQAGLGWRKGPMQASLGYLHREIKNEFGVRGSGGGGDSMVAFSLSIHPRP